MYTTNLTELANKYGTDKGDKHFEKHNYTPTYDKLFHEYRDKPVKMLEIGVLDPRFPGASIKMWKEYFSQLDFTGFDINEDAKTLEQEGVKIFIGDQSNTDDLRKCGQENGPFNIILDDGSHESEHMIHCAVNFFDSLAPGGYYIIEDLHVGKAKRQHTIESILTYLNPTSLESYYLDCNDKLLIMKKAL
jgi:hypothetical protein